MSSRSDDESSDYCVSDEEQQGQAKAHVPISRTGQTTPSLRDYRACKPKLKSINVKSFTSDLGCRRELRKRGNYEIKRAKQRRAKFRKDYPHADFHARLPSSEDDSDMDRSIDETNRVFPDFKELAQKCRFGRKSVFRDMAIFSIDQAVGWSHHQSTEGGNPFETRQLPAPNLLLDAITTSSSPLPITMLNHIGERFARRKSVPVKVATYKTIETASGNKRKKAGDETTEEHPSPPKKRSAKVRRDGKSFWKDTMDFSAKVGVGMVVEEMMTASLLPLARLHSARCRSLHPSKAFDEWTLPPDEAIHALRNHPIALHATEVHHPDLSEELKLMQDDGY